MLRVASGELARAEHPLQPAFPRARVQKEAEMETSSEELQKAADELGIDLQLEEPRLTAANVLQAIGRGDFDEGEALRRIVNAAQRRATYRTRVAFPYGAPVRIDAGPSASQWNGARGTVVKSNPTTVKVKTERGLVTVPFGMLVLEPASVKA